MVVGACGVAATAALAANPEPDIALGLIVKLKDSAPQSVVRLPSSVRPSDGERAQRQRLYSASIRNRVGFTFQKPTAFGAHVIHSGQVTTVAEAEAEAQRLRQDPDVEWVVVNQYEKPTAVARSAPIDVTGAGLAGGYANQFWLHAKSAGQEGVAGFRTAWDAIYAHYLGNTSTHQVGRVVTAVLDSGILYPQETTGRLIAQGYDFVSQPSYSNDGNGLDGDPTDPGDYNHNASASCEYQATSSWHGTMVTSMLTSPASDNRFGPGVLASLPGQVVLPVRIGGRCGALVSDMVEGMLWAGGVDYQGAPSIQNANPARVINVSYGGEGGCDPSTSTGALYRSTIAILRQKGAVVVASAGNGTGLLGTEGYTTPSRPAACEGAIAVTALRANGSKAKYANFVDGSGSASYIGVAVAAGDDDASEYLNLVADTGTMAPNGTFALRGEVGTSFAAPQVSGLFALLFAIDPSLTADEAVNLVRTNVSAFTATAGAQCSASVKGHCDCTTSTCGEGIIDAGAAVNAAIAGLSGRSDFVPPSLYASFFKPDRVLYAEREKRAGGGGASDWPTLVLMAVLASWMLGAALWQRLKARQAARVSIRARG